MSPEPPHSQVLDHCPNFAKILPTANHRGNSGSSSSRNNLNQEIGGSTSTTDNSNEPQLSVDNDVVYTIYGYQFCWTRFILFHILALIPLCGLPHLLAIWLPQIRCWKFRKSPLAYCDYVRCKCTTISYSTQITIAVVFCDSFRITVVHEQTIYSLSPDYCDCFPFHNNN